MNQNIILSNSETHYAFEVNPDNPLSMNENRFKIIFKDDLLDLNDSHSNNLINIHPNPVVDNLYVKLPDFENISLKIFNSLGQNVYSIENLLKEELTKIPIDEILKSVIYYIVIEIDSKLSNHKIIGK